MLTVYYACPFVPAELIAACGCTPQRLVAVCENNRLSEGMCSFAEAWLETLLNKTEDFVAVFTTSCDQMRRAFDFYCHQSGRDVFLLNVPSTDTLQTLNYYRQELERLRAFLCRVGKTTFDEDHLKKLMHSLGSKTEMPETKTDLKVAFVGGPVPVPVRNNVGAIFQDFNGSVFFDATEDVVVRQFLKFSPVGIEENPIQELATGYFQLPSIWKRPNDLFYDAFAGRIRDKGIKGIILFRHIFCDLWHSQVYEFKKRFNIPVLDIELDGKDSLSAAVVSRIQAFLEMLAA